MVDIAVLLLFSVLMYWPVLTLPLIYRAYGKMTTFFGFLLWITLMGGYIFACRIALNASEKLQPVDSVATEVGQMTVSTEVLFTGIVIVAIMGLIFMVAKRKVKHMLTDKKVSS